MRKHDRNQNNVQNLQEHPLDDSAWSEIIEEHKRAKTAAGSDASGVLSKAVKGALTAGLAIGGISAVQTMDVHAADGEEMEAIAESAPAEEHHDEAPAEEHHDDAPAEEHHDEAPAEEHHEDAPAPESAPAAEAAPAPAEAAPEAPAAESEAAPAAEEVTVEAQTTEAAPATEETTAADAATAEQAAATEAGLPAAEAAPAAEAQTTTEAGTAAPAATPAAEAGAQTAEAPETAETTQGDAQEKSAPETVETQNNTVSAVKPGRRIRKAPAAPKAGEGSGTEDESEGATKDKGTEKTDADAAATDAETKDGKDTEGDSTKETTYTKNYNDGTPEEITKEEYDALISKADSEGKIPTGKTYYYLDEDGNKHEVTEAEYNAGRTISGTDYYLVDDEGNKKSISKDQYDEIQAKGGKVQTDTRYYRINDDGSKTIIDKEEYDHAVADGDNKEIVGTDVISRKGDTYYINGKEVDKEAYDEKVKEFDRIAGKDGGDQLTEHFYTYTDKDENGNDVSVKISQEELDQKIENKEIEVIRDGNGNIVQIRRSLDKYEENGKEVDKDTYEQDVNTFKTTFNISAETDVNGKTYYTYSDASGNYAFDANDKSQYPEHAVIDADKGTITFYSVDNQIVDKEAYDQKQTTLKEEYHLSTDMQDGVRYYYYEDSDGTKHAFAEGTTPENAVISEDNGTITFYSKDGVRVSKTEYDAAVNMLKNEYNLTATVENGKTYYYYEDSLGKHSFEAGKAPELADISQDGKHITFYSVNGTRVDKSSFDEKKSTFRSQYNLEENIVDGKTYYYYTDETGNHAYMEGDQVPANSLINSDNSTITFYYVDGERVSKDAYDSAKGTFQTTYGLTEEVKDGVKYFTYEDSDGTKHAFEDGKAPAGTTIASGKITFYSVDGERVSKDAYDSAKGTFKSTYGVSEVVDGKTYYTFDYDNQNIAFTEDELTSSEDNRLYLTIGEKQIEIVKNSDGVYKPLIYKYYINGSLVDAGAYVEAETAKNAGKKYYFEGEDAQGNVVRTYFNQEETFTVGTEKGRKYVEINGSKVYIRSSDEASITPSSSQSGEYYIYGHKANGDVVTIKRDNNGLVKVHEEKDEEGNVSYYLLVKDEKVYIDTSTNPVSVRQVEKEYQVVNDEQTLTSVNGTELAQAFGAALKITSNFGIYADSFYADQHIDGNICVNKLSKSDGSRSLREIYASGREDVQGLDKYSLIMDPRETTFSSLGNQGGAAPKVFGNVSVSGNNLNGGTIYDIDPDNGKESPTDDNCKAMADKVVGKVRDEFGEEAAARVEQEVKISKNLDKIAEAGQKLIDETKGKLSYAVDTMKQYIAEGGKAAAKTFEDGQILLLNITSADLKGEAREQQIQHQIIRSVEGSGYTDYYYMENGTEKCARSSQLGGKFTEVKDENGSVIQLVEISKPIKFTDYFQNFIAAIGNANAKVIFNVETTADDVKNGISVKTNMMSFGGSYDVTASELLFNFGNYNGTIKFEDGGEAEGTFIAAKGTIHLAIGSGDGALIGRNVQINAEEHQSRVPSMPVGNEYSIKPGEVGETIKNKALTLDTGNNTLETKTRTFGQESNDLKEKIFGHEGRDLAEKTFGHEGRDLAEKTFGHESSELKNVKVDSEGSKLRNVKVDKGGSELKNIRVDIEVQKLNHVIRNSAQYQLGKISFNRSPVYMTAEEVRLLQHMAEVFANPIYATVEREDHYAPVQSEENFIRVSMNETPGTPDTPEGPGPETPEEGQVLGASRPRESGAVLGANRPRVLGARRVKTGDESTMLANGAAAAGAMGAAGLWAALRRKFSRRKRDDD